MKELNLAHTNPTIPWITDPDPVEFASFKRCSGHYRFRKCRYRSVAYLFIGYDFLNSGLASYRFIAWDWFDVDTLSIAFAFHLDALSVVFLFVITFVGFLIHVYSAGYMHDDAGFTRFFA